MNKVTVSGKGQDKTDRGENGACVTEEAAPRRYVSVKVMSKRESIVRSIKQSIRH